MKYAHLKGIAHRVGHPAWLGLRNMIAHPCLCSDFQGFTPRGSAACDHGSLATVFAHQGKNSARTDARSEPYQCASIIANSKLLLIACSLEQHRNIMHRCTVQGLFIHVCFHVNLSLCPTASTPRCAMSKTATWDSDDAMDSDDSDLKELYGHNGVLLTAGIIAADVIGAGILAMPAAMANLGLYAGALQTERS